MDLYKIKALIAFLFGISFNIDDVKAHVCEAAVKDIFLMHEARVLGESWKSAPWREGPQMTNYYNYPALVRTMRDPSLRPLALKWRTLSENLAEPTREEKRMFEASYQFMLGIADLRIKSSTPLGGAIGSRQPLIRYLEKALISLEAKTGDDSLHLQTIEFMNQRFFHKEQGFRETLENELFDFVVTHIDPALN